DNENNVKEYTMIMKKKIIIFASINVIKGIYMLIYDNIIKCLKRLNGRIYNRVERVKPFLN
ncbi:hypothetical protein, partial [Staphylococcus coagulans]|uniref:hypothetical protein n=1 Tax=Staphylococcus coagulans TaxID=74706 RepID=UPI001C70CAE6